jgi:hypothetical protein
MHSGTDDKVSRVTVEALKHCHFWENVSVLKK